MTRSATNIATFTFDAHQDRPWITQLTVPVGSTWRADAHWHERYTEYLIVVKGRALVTLNGVSRVVVAEDGPQLVDKFVVHEWMRADRDSVEKDDEDLIVEEWTDPGKYKLLKKNLLGVLNDGQRYWKSWFAIQALFICAEYDNFNELVTGGLSRPATYTVFAAIRGISKLLGLKPWYEEYTPEGLRQVAASQALSAT